MEFLELQIQNDWQERRWRRALRRLGLWHTARLIIVGLILIGLVVYLLPISVVFQEGVRLYLISVPLCILALWGLEFLNSNTIWKTMLALGIYSGLWLIAYLARPWGEGQFLHLPVWSSVFVLILSWVTLAYLLRRIPNGAARLGLLFEDIGEDLVIGFLVGGGIGVHYLYTLSSVRPLHVVVLNWEVLLWSFTYLAGLRVLGEELLFRGLVYSLVLQPLPQQEFWRPVLGIILFNVLISLMVAQGSNTLMGMWLLFYMTFLALINFYLRHQRKRILSCFVANVVFNLCVLVVAT